MTFPWIAASLLGVGAALSAGRRESAGAADEEAHFRALFDGAPVGIFRATTDGRLIDANPAFLTILGRAGAQLEEIRLTGEGSPGPTWWPRLIDAAGSGGKDGKASAEAVWSRSDGDVRRVRVTAALLNTPGGAVVQGVVEDVTDQVRLETQLRQSQKMEAVGQLTGGIAHDFNNLLSIVIANAELARSGPLSAAELDEVLRDVADAGRRGAELVRSLLGFSRQAPLHPVHTDLARLARGVTRMLRRVIPTSVHMELDIPEPVGLVHVDPGAVEQILLNLITNARDAMASGGSLTITVRDRELDAAYVDDHPWVEAGPYVEIAVADDGIGMDAEHRQRIFEPFFTTKPHGKGSGLGLSMAYGLVKQQSGMLHVYSEPGIGSTFSVLFPRVDGEIAEAAEHASVGHVDASSVTVLVVEDDPALARTADRVLREMGYRTVVAHDGEEALEVYRRLGSEIDVVLSDVVMPRMSGPELYRAVRGNPDAPAFVFASGYARQEAAQLDELLAEVEFVQKPWTINALRNAIENALGA